MQFALWSKLILCCYTQLRSIHPAVLDIHREADCIFQLYDGELEQSHQVSIKSACVVSSGLERVGAREWIDDCDWEIRNGLSQR